MDKPVLPYRPTVARLSTPGSLARLLLRGAIASISAGVLSYLLNVVAGSLIAHGLGVERYGAFATLTATLELLAIMLGLGLDTWLLHAGGRDPQALHHHLYQVLVIKLAGAALLGGGLLVGWLVGPAVPPLLLLGLGVILLDNLTNTAYLVLRAVRRNEAVAVLQVIGSLALVLALVGLLGLGIALQLPLLLGVQIGLGLLTAGMAAWAIRLQLAQAIRQRRLGLAAVWRSARLFVASDVLATIYGKFGLATVGLTIGERAAGLLKPALMLSTTALMIPTIVFYVALPVLSAPDAQGRRRRLLGLMTAGALLYGLAVIIGFGLFGQLALNLLFGAEYAASLPLLRIMSFIPLIKSCSLVCIMVMIIYDRQLLRVGLQSIVVVLTVAGSLLLIPRYALAGATWLYVAIELLLLALYTWGALHTLRQRAR